MNQLNQIKNIEEELEELTCENQKLKEINNKLFNTCFNKNKI